MSLIVDEHREYLSDDVRLRAFARALAHHVTPQSVVVDIGTGTGILALLACRAGAREDLARARPDFVPSLTPRGVARLTVLGLCDGRRPFREVERLVYERHATWFESPAEAAAFVAAVTAGYARS